MKRSELITKLRVIIEQQISALKQMADEASMTTLDIDMLEDFHLASRANYRMIDDLITAIKSYPE